MTATLTRWTEQHALLMSLGIAGVLLEKTPLLLAAMAVASFLGLLARFRRVVPAGQSFGLGNALTGLRVLATLALLLRPGLAGTWQAAIAMLLVGMDGLDGWAARRFGTVSGFGEVFDHESDAFLLLTLCLLLLLGDHLPAWVLLPGALRYAFVLWLRWGPPARGTVRGNRFTRGVGVLGTLTLAVCLWPGLPPPVTTGLAAGASLALAVSFLVSLWQRHRA